MWIASISSPPCSRQARQQELDRCGGEVLELRSVNLELRSVNKQLTWGYHFLAGEGAGSRG